MSTFILTHIDNLIGEIKQRLLKEGVDEAVIDRVFNGEVACHEENNHISMKRRTKSTASMCKVDITPEPASSSQPEKEDLTVVGDDIVIVVNYGARSHAIFGDFGTRYKFFKDKFLKPCTFISYNHKLAFGTGWVIMDKSKLPELERALKSRKLAYRKIERRDYEKEVLAAKKKEVEPETVDSDEEVVDSDEEVVDSDEEVVDSDEEKESSGEEVVDSDDELELSSDEEVVDSDDELELSSDSE